MALSEGSHFIKLFTEIRFARSSFKALHHSLVVLELLLLELLLDLFRVKKLKRVGHELKALIRLIGDIERERWLKLAHS